MNQIRDGADGVDLAKKYDLTNHDNPRTWCERPANGVNDLLCGCDGCGVVEFTYGDAVTRGALRQRVVERAMFRRRGKDFVAGLELLSAAVVFWRFRFALGEARASRIAGGLLLALAGFVVLTSILNLFGYCEPQRSLVGILLAAAVMMPWLARRKRKLAVIMSSAALKADAAESALCGYMAWIALAGLAVNGVWGKSWATLSPP